MGTCDETAGGGGGAEGAGGAGWCCNGTGVCSCTFGGGLTGGGLSFTELIGDENKKDYDKKHCKINDSPLSIYAPIGSSSSGSRRVRGYDLNSS